MSSTFQVTGATSQTFSSNLRISSGRKRCTHYNLQEKKHLILNFQHPSPTRYLKPTATLKLGLERVRGLGLTPDVYSEYVNVTSNLTKYTPGQDIIIEGKVPIHTLTQA